MEAERKREASKKKATAKVISPIIVNWFVRPLKLSAFIAARREARKSSSLVRATVISPSDYNIAVGLIAYLSGVWTVCMHIGACSVAPCTPLLRDTTDKRQV